MLDDNTNSVCFVQLTRLGDLVQTYRVATLLKKVRPKIKIYLLARKQFASPLNFLLKECFEKIYFLEMDVLEKSKKKLNQFLEEVNSHNFDLLINFSWCKASEQLSTMVKANGKRGLRRGENNQVIIDDSWSKIVYALTMRGPYGPYNLVDIYKSMIGLNEPIPFSISKHQNKEKEIVIHPFASNERRYWKISKWVEIIYKILKNHPSHTITVVGGEEDKLSVEVLFSTPVLHKFKDRIKIMVGEGNIEELSSILSSCSIFVGHDSFVAHLAALNDIPVVTVPLGTSRPVESAPYSKNAYIITPKTSCFPCSLQDKCNFYQCHLDIPYLVVVEVISAILKNGQLEIDLLEKNVATFLISSVSIFKSDIKKSNFLLLKEITSSYPSVKDIFLIFYQMAYLYLFNEVEEEYTIPVLTKNTAQELDDSLDGLESFYELYEFGKKYSKEILEELSKKEPSSSKIKECSDNIDEIDRLQNLLGESYPQLKPIVDYSIVDRNNLLGDNIIALSENSFYSYYRSSILSSIVYQLCQKTLNNYNPSFNQKKRREVKNG